MKIANEEKTSYLNVFGLPPMLPPATVGILIGGEEKPISPGTLANWRSMRSHPELEYTKVGRYVRYPLDSVLNFIKLRTYGIDATNATQLPTKSASARSSNSKDSTKIKDMLAQEAAMLPEAAPMPAPVMVPEAEQDEENLFE